MPGPNMIAPDKFARLIGTPSAPALIDVRTQTAFAADPHLIPGARQRDAASVGQWGASFAGKPAVVACAGGHELSQGVAAWLRQEGCVAEVLDGGHEGWRAAGLPRVPEARLPRRDLAGRTVWVTRARPKVDRIACPWLIRRFVDPEARFLFVAPSEVLAVADKFDAAPFDVSADGVFWSHRRDLCTFDVMIDELELGSVPGLGHLATIVRGADTDRVDLAPQAAGLLAVSLGLSRMYSDDIEQLDAGMLVYDALYRWCRDAVDETHDWVSHLSKGRAKA